MKVKKTKKNGKVKEPSLLRKIITVYYENAMRKKAERILSKQIWSIDYLSQVLLKASQSANKLLIMTVTDCDGKTITLRSDIVNKSKDENIFDKLDDDLAIENYIRAHSSRG